jgi:hypothetical protein
VKLFEVADVKPEAAAPSVMDCVGVKVTLHPTNVATPLTAVSGFAEVQASVPALEDSVIEALLEVTTLPNASSTLTTG